MITDAHLENLPESPGVYQFKDRDGNIIYIGKAKSLRDRVRSYVREGIKDIKTRKLVEHIDRVDFVLTGSETEAFLLENNLIKEHRPKYNIDLKDNKTYISLKLTVDDPYPALYATRKIVSDGSLYFGPYPHATEVRDVLKLIERIYPIRKCRETVFRKRKRACMLRELGKCLGPCEGGVDRKEYGKIIDELRDFLSGKDEKVLKDIEARISKAIGSWNFEEAQALKERFMAIKGMTERQHVHEHLGKNRDVWAFAEEEKQIMMALLAFRRGVLISRRRFKESYYGDLPGEAIMTFLFQYYGTTPIPDEIVLSEDLEEKEALERYLRDRRRGAVKILGPRHHATQDVVRLAIENLHEPEPVAVDEAFKRSLHLMTVPKRIEIYDISHIQGKSPTGAMVVFEGFRPAKNAYRVFHIRGTSTMDDVAMLDEVLRRRLGDLALGPLPDLFIIDGGKGQLAAAKNALRICRVDRDIISIAKGEGRKRMEDLIYLPGRKNPLAISKASPVFKEIVRMRDEAHRFAVASHRRRRRREDLKLK